MCTLLVPKGMSKSSNSCPSHTCQISVSLSFLWRPWRAAAPLPAEEQQELWSQQRLCAASRSEGKMELAPYLPLRWLRAWCKAPGCCLLPPAYDIGVCRIPVSEQIRFENCCSDIYAVYFDMNQGLWLTVPAGYGTGKSHRNHDGRWYTVMPPSLPSSHRCLAKS